MLFSDILLVTLVGLPGAGKTTIVSELIKTPHPNLCYLLVEFDNYLSTNASTESEDSWKAARQELLNDIENCLHIIQQPTTNLERLPFPTFIECTKKEKDVSQILVVLLDDNFYYHSMRKQYYGLAKLNGYKYASLCCRCCLDLCLQRNGNRMSPIATEILVQMSGKIEWPDPQLHHWESSTTTLDTTSTISEDMLAQVKQFFLLTALKLPIYATEVAAANAQVHDMKVTAESAVHQLDNCLRACVGKILRSSSEPDRLVIKQVVTQAKSMALENLKSSAPEKHNSLSTAEFCAWIETQFHNILKNLTLDK